MFGRRLRVLAAVLLPAAFAQEVLYHIDVVNVVCNRGESVLTVTSPDDTERGSIYVPVLYRTSTSPTRVNFSLVDSANTVIIDAQAFDLAELPDTRRLEDALASGDCNELFLLDGRSPVFMPDTWQEARVTFGELCALEAGSPEICMDWARQVFQGRPEGDEEFTTDRAFCEPFAKLFGVPMMLSRRLKGSTPSGYVNSRGATASNAFVNGKRQNMGTYGYTAGTLGSRFPNGATTTRYGFAGRGGYLPYVAAGMVGFWIVSGSAYRSGHYRDRYQREGEGESCTDRYQCSYRLANNEQTVRDDLMEFGFMPNEFVYPLQLRLTEVSGPDYARQRICPPPPGSPSLQQWRPPTRQDLFFGLSAAEPLDDADEDMPVWAIVVLVLGSVACCCFVVILVWRIYAKKWGQGAVRQLAEQDRCSDFPEGESQEMHTGSHLVIGRPVEAIPVAAAAAQGGSSMAVVAGRPCKEAGPVDVKDVSVDFAKDGAGDPSRGVRSGGGNPLRCWLFPGASSESKSLR